MDGLSWTAVEDLVLTALQAQIGESVRTLETYQGNWREDLQRKGWRLPAVRCRCGWKLWRLSEQER